MGLASSIFICQLAIIPSECKTPFFLAGSVRTCLYEVMCTVFAQEMRPDFSKPYIIELSNNRSPRNQSGIFIQSGTAEYFF